MYDMSCVLYIIRDEMMCLAVCEGCCRWVKIKQIN